MKRHFRTLIGEEGGRSTTIVTTVDKNGVEIGWYFAQYIRGHGWERDMSGPAYGNLNTKGDECPYPRS